MAMVIVGASAPFSMRSIVRESKSIHFHHFLTILLSVSSCCVMLGFIQVPNGPRPRWASFCLSHGHDEVDRCSEIHSKFNIEAIS